jgi:hypothetical protein
MKRYTIIHFDSYGEVEDRYNLLADSFQEAFERVCNSYEIEPEAYKDALISFACCQYQEGDTNFLIVEL